MEWFPVRTVLVPVESGPNSFLPNLEILAKPINDNLKGRALLRAFADKMSSLMPRHPIRTRILPLGLHVRQFLHQLVVETPVLFLPKELGDDNDIIVLEGLVKDLDRVGSDMDPQIRADQRRCRVEGLGVASVASCGGLLGDTGGGVLATRIRLDRWQEPFILFLLDNLKVLLGDLEVMRTQVDRRRTRWWSDGGR